MVRDVEIYYSVQEDVSFFFWKIKHDALLENVSFEKWDGDDYASIDLDKTLFPAAPVKCGAHWCFQYQIPGKFENDEEQAPIRSIHVDQGIFAGSKPRLQEVEITFTSEPIGIDNNVNIDPHLFDWFKENKVALKRKFEWQFRESPEDRCRLAATEWKVFKGNILTAHDWVENAFPTCFSLRPKRQDRKGAEILTRFRPSAETIFDKQRYDVPTQSAHVVYGVLIDLEISNDNRCEQIKKWLDSTIEGAIRKNSQTYKKLDIYTPLATDDGQALSGCEQRTMQDFPIAQMLRDARSEIAVSENPVRIVWIYVNNINQAPAERVLFQIAALQTSLEENGAQSYHLGIGSDFIIRFYDSSLIPDNLKPADDTGEEPEENPFRDAIGWRPIEDQTFGADIRSWAKANLPFQTMLHDRRTEIPIKKWREASAAKRFKICQSTPFEVDRLGIHSPKFEWTPNVVSSLPWPEDEDPFFAVEIPAQFLLSKKFYTRQRVDTVIEACLRFCSHRFQTKTREIFENWKETTGQRPMEVCQWTE